jgi:hypothetical protein
MVPLIVTLCGTWKNDVRKFLDSSGPSTTANWLRTPGCW